MDKSRLLDLFCGAGGMGQGLSDAGFDVTGVDNIPQPRYPFRFIQADAFEYLDTADLSQYDAIHASPPCQGYTELNYVQKARHPKLIGVVRERLQAIGLPYVIENVDGARREFPQALMLCGSMFGLRIRRHRLFESNILLFAPGACQHDRNFYSIHGDHVWNRAKMGDLRKDGRRRPGSGTFAEGLAAMGIDWMERQKELANAIPPAYGRWIGAQLMDAIRAEQEVAS